MIDSLDQMVEQVLLKGKKFRIAIVWAHDINTVYAVKRAVNHGIIEPVLMGIPDEIRKIFSNAGMNLTGFNIIPCETEEVAAAEAVRMVNAGEADIIMKGLLGTDKFLKSVMDKGSGLMNNDALLSFIGVIQIPSYKKLLFVTDPAVIPFPDYNQKMSMLKYAIEVARKFGISSPKVALIGASEKVSRHFPNSLEFDRIVKETEGGKKLNCIVDGPLDLFLACDPESVEIKGIKTPVNGDADVLLFPALEASNPFYKSLMLFADGEIAGMIMGTKKPVVVMSRSESEKSKFYCIALSCLMAV